MSHLVCAWTVPHRASAAAAMRLLRNIFIPSYLISREKQILAYFPRYHVGQGERGRQSRRLDSKQMHQAGHAMLARALDLEVRRGLARPGGLRPDAGVARQQRAVGQSGPIAPDRRVEALRAARVDRIVFLTTDAIHPFDVGAEARLPGEVERHVDTEPARLGHRIDQAREGILAAQGVVVAFRVKLSWDEFPFEAIDAGRDRGRSEAGAVDEDPAFYRLASLDVQFKCILY